MKRAFVCSDSHGDEAGLRRLLRYAWRDGLPVGLYIHLGDGADDFAAVDGMIWERDPGSLRLKIRGNMDFGCYDAAEWMTQPFGGHLLFLTHGNRHGVKRLDYSVLTYAAQEKGCDAALFGHTHRAFIGTMDGVLLVNPGSVRDSGTLAVLEEDGAGRLTARQIRLPDR